MNQEQRKERVQAWKTRHPDMGVIRVLCTKTGDRFLASAKDTNARLNRFRFQLATGDESNKQLNALWKQYGADAFEIAVYKRMDYKDPPEDHYDELDELFVQCLKEDPQAVRLGR